MAKPKDLNLIEMFLEMMTAERGVAANTVAAYRRDLVGASQLLDGQLNTAGKSEIGKLSSEWSGLANSSVARKSSALRRFFGFLEEEGIRQNNPSSALPKPSQKRPLPKILENSEVDLLFQTIAERAILDLPNTAHLSTRNNL